MNQILELYTKKPDELVRTILREGWSQEQLAASVDVTQATISRILSGQHKDPRYSVVEKLRETAAKLLELTDGR